LVGFFKRSKNGQTDRGIAIEESAIGGFDDYANPLLGTTEGLELTFLLSGTVDETRPADPAAQADDEALYVLVEGEPRVPRFSRREKFVSEVLANHPLVAPAMVNRLWGLLMGRGLVHPIERMDSSNRPSHPELLDELAADFRGQGYDIRRLVRGIVLSEAYQRSADSQGRSLPVDAYAVAMVKPLTAEAYGASVQIALADADAAEADPSWEKLAVHWRTFFPEVIATSDQATIDQALGLTNGSQFNDVLRQSAANWVAATVGLTLEQQVQLAYRRCFARLPDSEELAQVQAFLAARSDRAVDGWTQVFWTLVTAAEFRFNH
jgi:hypothetical protein